MNQLDRRTFMQRTGLAGVSLLAYSLGSYRAAADPDAPPMVKGSSPAPTTSPEPDVHPFQIGGVEAFVVSDGQLTFPGIQPAFAPEAKPAEIEALMKREFLPADHLSLGVNVLVVRAKSGVMLFDGGAGGSFGPTAGRLVRGLARIGVTPSDVKTVFVTHAHPDHIAGLVDASNGPVFPSAKVIAAKAEVDFWTSDAPDLSGMKTPPEARSQLAAGMKAILGNLKSQLEPKEPGHLTSEVELVAAPGHTPGHAMFRVTQGAEQLLVIGDALHVYALQFLHPEWTMAYDVDPARAISTRRKLFKDAATERTLLLGYHLPFPGLGHVRAARGEYEWVPRPWAV
jgi:glyoxylase-like metal-dependent hydrolase (beta-lactamase superfamily II)